MLTDEKLITFTEASTSLPLRNGRPVHSSSIWRWARRGIGGIQLETLRIGGRYLTSLPALERFTKNLTDQDVLGSHITS